jgi:multiple antibiotic resistance protein
MTSPITPFISLLTTLLAVINRLEAIPVDLGLTDDQPDAEQRQVARQARLAGFASLFPF